MVKKKSIFNRFLILMIAVIILPMVLAYSFVSSALIEQLYENYNETVKLSAQVASQSIKEAVGNVVDVSVSIIGNDRVREYLTCDRDDRGYLEKYVAAQTALNSYMFGNSYIQHISVASAKDDRLVTVGYSIAYEFSEEEKEKLLSSSGRWFWNRESNDGISVCRLIRDVDNNESKLGFIKIVVNSKALKRQFFANNAETQFTYALVDQVNSDIILTTDTEEEHDILELLDNQDKVQRAGSYYVWQNDRRYFVYRRFNINARPSYLVVVARDQTVYYAMLRYGIIFLMIVLFVIFYGLYALIYRRNIGLPLTMLRNQMKQLKPGSGAPEQISIRAEGEVKELVDSFNAMAAQLDTLYETNYKNELKLRDANLLVLQSEINPHFLYNVLDSIRWMIELGEKKAASAMVQKLSEMFRLTLGLSEKGEIALGKELDHLDKYIVLEKYRFGDKIRFHINIQEGISDLMVVKFVLQPLVENAITHGIGPNQGRGNIVISVYVSDNTLIYDIRDDGRGADPEKIAEILEQRLVKENSLEGFALENIQSRLQLKYGQAYGITYRLREGGGSIFTVRQPLVYQEGGRKPDAEADDCG